MLEQEAAEPNRRLDDEQGGRSMSRMILAFMIPFIMGLVVADAVAGLKIGTAVWSMLTSITIVAMGWAAGPRMAQYILPQLGAIVASISAGKGTGERPGGASTEWLDHDSELRPRNPSNNS